MVDDNGKKPTNSSLNDSLAVMNFKFMVIIQIIEAPHLLELFGTWLLRHKAVRYPAVLRDPALGVVVQTIVYCGVLPRLGDTDLHESVKVRYYYRERERDYEDTRQGTEAPHNLPQRGLRDIVPVPHRTHCHDAPPEACHYAIELIRSVLTHLILQSAALREEDEAGEENHEGGKHEGEEEELTRTRAQGVPKCEETLEVARDLEDPDDADCSEKAENGEEWFAVL